MSNYLKYFLMLSFLSIIFIIQGCEDKVDSGEELSPHLVELYKKTNGFVDEIYTLHKKRLADQEYYTKESIGGYGGLTNDLEFYKEINYYDEKMNKKLSSIKWERKNPNQIHMIDVFIYDDEGRLKREYSAAYHPTRRTSPLSTLITMHYYGEKYHSFREFDSFDIQTYEECNNLGDETTLFANHYEDIPDTYNDLEEGQRKSYRECFEHTNNSAEPYLSPLSNIQTGTAGS